MVVGRDSGDRDILHARVTTLNGTPMIEDFRHAVMRADLGNVVTFGITSRIAR